MCGIIEEHQMSQMVVTTITWFIWCHFSLPQVGISTYGPTTRCSIWSGSPLACCKLPAQPSLERLRALSLAASALAQLLSVTVVTAAAVDVRALTTLSVVAAVLARDDPYPPSAGFIVVICPTQRQCLCLRHILLRLGRLEGVSPWLHGQRWPQAASSRKRWAVSPFKF